MAKKNKNTGGKGHNKVASVVLIGAGLFFAGLPLTADYMYSELKILMVVGIVMLTLGGILFSKSFLNKD
jgi:uncharacterized membrane protein HdeD (DUF308 family)